MSDTTDASWRAPMTIEEETEFLYFLNKVPPEDHAALLTKLASAMKDSPGDDDTDGVESRLATKMTSAETEDTKELNDPARTPARKLPDCQLRTGLLISLVPRTDDDLSSLNVFFARLTVAPTLLPARRLATRSSRRSIRNSLPTTSVALLRLLMLLCSTLLPMPLPGRVTFRTFANSAFNTIWCPSCKSLLGSISPSLNVSLWPLDSRMLLTTGPALKMIPILSGKNSSVVTALLLK